MGSTFDKISAGLADALAFTRGDTDRAKVWVRGYRVLLRPLTPEEGGGILAEVPALPGCMSDGETVPEAIRYIEDAVDAWIAMAEKHGDSIPEPYQDGASRSR